MDRLRAQWMRLIPGAGMVLLAIVLVFGLAAGAVLAQEDEAEDADSPFAENVVTTTVLVNANLRAEPGLDAEILQVLAAGTLVGFTGFTDASGDWVQVDPVDAPVGWMHRTVLTSVPEELQVRPEDLPDDAEGAEVEQESEADFAENVVTGQTLFRVYLRSSPEQSFNVIETLDVGTVVGYTGFMDGTRNWIQVDPVGAPVGWVWREFLSNVPEGLQIRPADLPDEAADEEEAEDEAAMDEDAEPEFAANVVTTTTTANANLRAAPGLDAEIIQVVPAGTVVGFTGFTDANRAWVQVDPSGDAPVGWIHATLLGFVPEGLQIADLD